MSQPSVPDMQPDSDNATDDQPQSAVPRVLVILIAIVVIGLLLGLPLLRALVLEQDDDTTRRDAVSTARHQVALLFADAVLERRSNQAAERYIVTGIEEQVRSFIGDLRRRDSAELEDAVATTERIMCRQPATGGECFRARLARPGEEPVTEITFVVAITDGAARVIAIGSGGIVLRH